MLVYKIINKINGKTYIGQTTRSIEDRWIEHCKPANELRSYISNAIQKHGKENFVIEELSKAVTQEELDALESKLIETHRTMSPNGYNLRMGGSGGALSEEVKLKISMTSKGKKLNEQSIAKMKATKRTNKHLYVTYNETTVKCSKCKNWKDRKDFDKNRARKSGVQFQCKICRPKNRPDMKHADEALR